VWIDPVTAQEMMTFRDDTAFSVAKRVQAMSDTRTAKVTSRSRAGVVGQLSQDLNLWKSGVRFSLKAATPSFDSAVS
jgi:hypothetical protein